MVASSLGTPSKRIIIIVACCTRLPRWQDLCYCASCELLLKLLVIHTG